MPKHDKVLEPQLRQRFQSAHKELLGGRHTEAVHTLSDAFLKMLTEHPEIATGSTMPIDEVSVHGGWIDAFSANLKWPQIGANLVPESVRDGSPRIEYSTDRFSLSEAITYYEFAVDTAIKNGL